MAWQINQHCNDDYDENVFWDLQNNIVGLNVRKKNYNKKQTNKKILASTPCLSVLHFVCKQIYIHLSRINLENEQMSVSSRKEAKFLSYTTKSDS